MPLLRQSSNNSQRLFDSIQFLFCFGAATLLSFQREVSAFGLLPLPLPAAQIVLDGSSTLFSTFPSILLNGDFSDVAATAASGAAEVLSQPETSNLLQSAGDVFKNIAVAVTAVAFLFAGLTTLAANVLIPAAAEELRKECQELAPELWEEFQAKLEPDQSISQRPELMQELGAKLQPLLDAKIVRMQESGELSPDNPFVPTAIPPPPSSLSPWMALPQQKSDNDDDDWTGSQVDLSALTDQIQAPTTKTSEEDTEHSDT